MVRGVFYYSLEVFIMNNLKRYILAALFATLFTGLAHAGVVGDSSDHSNVKAGESNVISGPHVKGRPGIGVRPLPGGVDARVDFQGLTPYAPADSHGVSSIVDPNIAPKSHKGMGVFHFAKVSGADVYFGEWSEKGKINDGTHTVYYAGDDSGTTVPASGIANYSVKGISDYGNKGVLSGTFEADFTSRLLMGSLSNGKSGADRYSLDIGIVDILGTRLSGNGAKVSYGNSTSVTSGVVTGRFFGANAKALAGIATFKDNRQFDTAFGGAKN